jgi:hypothetical protein
MKLHLKTYLLISSAIFLFSKADVGYGQTKVETPQSPASVAVADYNQKDWEHAPIEELTSAINAASQSQIIGLTNPIAWHFILQRLDWSQLSTNAVETCSFVAYRNANEKDIVNAPSSVQQIMGIILLRPTPYLENDDLKRMVFLKHCASQLRLSIDTNQVEAACNQLTNQVKVDAIKRAVNDALDYFNKVGLTLDDKNVKLSSWNGMYSSHVTVNSIEIVITFFQKEMSVASIQGRKNKTQAFFFRNGKLERFSNGIVGLRFREDGSMDLDRTYGFNK